MRSYYRYRFSGRSIGWRVIGIIGVLVMLGVITPQRILTPLKTSLGLAPGPRYVYTGSVRVIDGDTMDFVGGPRIRLMGINTPELTERPGKHAADWLRAYIGDSPVTCEDMGSRSYGRIVGQCIKTRDGTDIAAALILAGHAKPWCRYNGAVYNAEASRIGLTTC